MLTSSSFFSLQTQHDQSQRKQAQQATQTKHKKPNDGETEGEEVRVPSAGLSYVKLCDTAASVH